MTTNGNTYSLGDKKTVLARHNVTAAKYRASGLDWRDLTKICRDYYEHRDDLHACALFLSERLRRIPRVHLVSYRVKDYEHLAVKIVRSCAKKGRPYITIENYRQEIGDIIGVRALHVFKDDWPVIDAAIRRAWQLKRKPTAYVHNDSAETLKRYKDNGCRTEEKEGYRSVHYDVVFRPFRAQALAEIQVRTVFEEAWGEVSHTVRYPTQMDNLIFKRFTDLTSQLTGQADQISLLARVMREREDLLGKPATDARDRALRRIESRIDGLASDLLREGVGADSLLPESRLTLSQLRSLVLGS